MVRDQISSGVNSDNRKAAMSRFVVVLLSVLLAVLLFVNIFLAVWTANQFKAKAVLPDTANILIVWPENNQTSKKFADWLGLSLRAAGFNVQTAESDQPLWVITLGNADASSVELALSWPQANLMMIDPVPADDQNWLDWANKTASIWPPEKKMFIVSSKTENDSLLTLYELMSGEDALLFPGFDTGRGRNIKSWLSLDANFGISVAPVGSQRLPWLSAAFIDEITAVVAGQSDINEPKTALETISGRTYQASQTIQTVRLVSYIAVVSFLLFQIILAQLWLMMINRNLIAVRPKISGSDLLVFCFSLLSIIVFSLNVLILHGLAFLPAISWYMIAALLLLSVIFAMPAAFQGYLQRQEYLDQLGYVQSKEPGSQTISQYKQNNIPGVLALFITALMILAAMAAAVYYFIIAKSSYDSWFWIAAAAALLLTGGFTARQLAYAGSGRLVACIAGGWLTMLSFSMLSAFLY